MKGTKRTKHIKTNIACHIFIKIGRNLETTKISRDKQSFEGLTMT